MMVWSWNQGDGNLGDSRDPLLVVLLAHRYIVRVVPWLQFDNQAAGT